MKRRVASLSTSLHATGSSTEANLSNSSLQPHYLPVTDSEDSLHQSAPDRPLYSICILAITCILLFADQNLLAPNLTAIAQEFNLTPQERDSKLGGQLALAFFCWGAPVSLLVGYWADVTTRRPLLLASVVILGESACAMSFFARDFAQLFWCRALTGISLGGSMPLLYSLLGDLFPASERHIVTAMLSIGTGLGTGLGQGIAGFVGPVYGWRLPFLLVSLPAVSLGVLIALTVSDPPRGGMEVSSNNNNNNNNTLHDNDSLQTQETATYSESVSRSSGEFAASDRQSIDEICALPTNGSAVCETACPPLSVEADTLPPLPVITPAKNASVCDHVLVYLYKFRALFQTPTYVLALLQGSPGCLPWGVVNTYLNDYLSTDKGMSVQVSESGCLSACLHFARASV
jgi:Major Facilitator Superfamily